MRVKVHISLWTIRKYPKRHFRYLSDSGDTFLPLHGVDSWRTYNLQINYGQKQQAVDFSFVFKIRLATWHHAILFWTFPQTGYSKLSGFVILLKQNIGHFRKKKIANKGIDALNLCNILNQKFVKRNIPPYVEYKELSCISYSYTSPVATTIFNYKTSLQQLNFQILSQNPLPCSCSGSEFLHAPCGHIVTGDLNIIRNDKLRDHFRKGPKYREPVSFSWHQNFDIIMDACKA